MIQILVDGAVVAYTNPEEVELRQWAAAQVIVNAMAKELPDVAVHAMTQGGALILPEPHGEAEGV